MAHKTLVNGTAYEITGGKTLVDGTAYSIKSGKTLAGGTVYEVGFGGGAVVVMVFIPDGSGKRAVIDGVIYTESGTYEGLEKVTVTVDNVTSGSSVKRGRIYLNGTKVAESSGEPPFNLKSASYTLALRDNSVVVVDYRKQTDKGTNGTYDCYIIENCNEMATVTIDRTFDGDHGGGIVVNAAFPPDASSAVNGITNNPATISAKTTSKWSYSVPIGTIITCTAAQIYQNGTRILNNVAVNDTISFMVTGDTLIQWSAESQIQSDTGYAEKIVITKP